MPDQIIIQGLRVQHLIDGAELVSDLNNVKGDGSRKAFDKRLAGPVQLGLDHRHAVGCPEYLDDGILRNLINASQRSLSDLFAALDAETAHPPADVQQ